MKDRQKELDRKHKWNESHKKEMVEYNHHRNRRIKELVRALKNQSCVDCGIQYPYYVMDFDHVSGAKKFGIGSRGAHTVESALNEIAKCDVVCANCHRKREWERRTK